MTRDGAFVRDGLLYSPHDPSLPPLAVGSDVWWAWLTQPVTRRFRVEAAGVTYTARAERRRGARYWYAYRRTRGRLRKVYLGRSQDLTLARLTAAAASLQAPPDRTTAARPSGAAASHAEHTATALLPTKLAIPQLRSATVARPRLWAVLDRSVAYRLTLIQAPAGYGKTTLLASWAAGTRLPVTWLTLDAGDSDAARLWTAITAALRRVAPGIDRSHHVIPTSAPRIAEVVLPALADALSGVAPDVVLVLDEADAAGPALWDAVQALLDRLPRLHLIVAARARPPLPLARMRARGELLDVRAGALRFSADEAAALLGAFLPPEAIAALTAQMEGWAAGLQLTALALRDASAGEPGAAQQLGVREYLIEDVVRFQPPEVQRFLRATSILDPLCAELCAALLAAVGDDGARAWSLLDDVERAGLFLTALDTEGRWYRYHPLFAAALRTLLEREDRMTVPRLHQAASAWYARQGQPEPAVEHALQADDPLTAAALVTTAAPRAIARGEWATVIRWTAALPDAALLAHPDLLVMAGWGLLIGGRVAEARRPLALLDTLPGAAHAADRATLRAYRAVVERDAAGLRAFAPAALDVLAAAGGLLYGVIAIPAALAGAVVGETDAIARSLVVAADAADAQGDGYTARTARHLLAQLALARGRLHEAAAIYRRELPELGEHSAPPLDAIPLVGLGAILWLQGDPAAGALLEQGWAAAQRLGDGGVGVGAAIALARLRLSQGDAAGADALLDEVMRRVGRDRAAGFRAPLAAHRALAALRRGDRAAAQRWVAVSGLMSAAEAPTLLQAVEELALAQVWIATGDAAAAAGRLAQLRDQAAAGGWDGWRLESEVLLAVALQRGGNGPGAAMALARALALAAPQGARQAFLDAGAAVAALLDEHRTALTTCLDPAALQFAADIRAALTPPRDLQPSMGAPAESLSARELEVLRLVAEGHTNQAVADRLVVAVGTVKKHLHTICGKLGVRTRTAAVARARVLGILCGND